MNNERAPSSNSVLINIKALEKNYPGSMGDVLALKGINLQVQQGDFVAILGKSGAGKSTLINMITGIDKPTNGEVWVADKALHLMSEEQTNRWRGKNVGVIFQSFHLMPMLSCNENVALPMDFANLYQTPSERKARAMELLDLVGLADHANKLPSAVSGGQRQRVAIARALANNPSFLAADEPTGNLDSNTANEVFMVFEKLVENGVTIIMTTHDVDLANRVTRTIILSDGEIFEDKPC